MQHHNPGLFGRPAAWQGLSVMVLASQMGAKLGLQKSSVDASHFSRVAAFMSDQPARFERALVTESRIAALRQSRLLNARMLNDQGSFHAKRMRTVVAAHVAYS
ncbi:hypothetical protein J2X02_003386 [Pseudoxanthomonas japonensis]|nr:hypothetical protein [Pseudoxanthomonas japonensis]